MLQVSWKKDGIIRKRNLSYVPNRLKHWTDFAFLLSWFLGKGFGCSSSGNHRRRVLFFFFWIFQMIIIFNKNLLIIVEFSSIHSHTLFYCVFASFENTRYGNSHSGVSLRFGSFSFFPPLPAGISRYNKILQLLLKEYAVSKAWLHVPTWTGGWGGQLHKRGNAGSKVMWIINFAAKEVFFYIT